MSSELLAVLQRTDTSTPDPADLEALRTHLQQTPAVALVLADVATGIAKRIIEGLTMPSFLAVALMVRYETMLAELAGPQAPPLEKLLAEQVALCWLRLQAAEHYYQNAQRDSREMAVLDYYERKLSATQRRYLRALETLAKVRRLGINIQINLAHQQVVNG